MSNNFSKKSDIFFCDCTTLDKAELNCPYVIISCALPRPLQTRFAELGFVKGVKVTVTKKAPLGDPLEITLMGYSLCARANEAKYIKVTRVKDE